MNKDDWSNCIYCGRSMWVGNHRPKICNNRECRNKSDEDLKELRSEGK